MLNENDITEDCENYNEETDALLKYIIIEDMLNKYELLYGEEKYENVMSEISEIFKNHDLDENYKKHLQTYLLPEQNEHKKFKK